MYSGELTGHLKRRTATRHRPSYIPWSACFTILFIAAACAWLFNAFMPQGISLTPSYLSHPLWRPASLERAAELWSQNALFVDARDPGQYKRGHIRRAINLSPLERENLYPLLKPSLSAAKIIVVYGHGFSQNPAADIAQFLRKQGFENVWVMEASLDDWRAAGYAVREPRRPRANSAGGSS